MQSSTVAKKMSLHAVQSSLISSPAYNRGEVLGHYAFLGRFAPDKLTRVGSAPFARNRLEYITCQNLRTFKFRAFYFGHFLSHFGHISDQISDTLLKHGVIRFTPIKHEYRLKQHL